MSTHPRFKSRRGQPRTGLVQHLGRLTLLALPLALLLIASFRLPNAVARLLWMGVLFQGLGILLALWTRQGGREPLGPALIMLYIIALGWMLFSSVGRPDWFLYVAQAI